MKTTLFLKIWFLCIVREKGKKKKNKKKHNKTNKKTNKKQTKTKTAHSSLNIQLIHGNENWQKEEKMPF